jgi:integrase
MLTVPQIKGFKPKTTPYYKWDVDGQRGSGKLGLQITPKGSKQFVFRYFKDGKAKFVRLGKYPEFSLSEARQRIKAYGAMLQQDLDPVEEIAISKKELAQTIKVESQKGSITQLFESYTNKMQTDGKRTFKAVLAALEKEVYPNIPKDSKAKDITPTDIKLILGGMIQRGATVQSNRVRSYLLAAFNHGLKHDNDPAFIEADVLFGLSFNPVAAVPKQSHAEKVGENWLTLNETKHLLSTFQHTNRVGPMPSYLLALCFHTGGQRPYELAASKWDCIDWLGKTWTVKAEISKNKREHLIPLTDTAISLLNELKANTGPRGNYIFAHGKSVDQHMRVDTLSKSVARYRQANPKFNPFIARDIRRTVKTLMGELGISKSIRDRLQNHSLQDVSSKYYDRYEYMPEKRLALESWEQQLMYTLNSNVIAIGGKQ